MGKCLNLADKFLLKWQNIAIYTTLYRYFEIDYLSTIVLIGEKTGKGTVGREFFIHAIMTHHIQTLRLNDKDLCLISVLFAIDNWQYPVSLTVHIMNRCSPLKVELKIWNQETASDSKWVPTESQNTSQRTILLLLSLSTLLCMFSF